MTDPPLSDQSCDYCGLPLLGRRRRAAGAATGPAYCCSGCAFAASVLAADGADGVSPRTLLKLGLGVFFAMNVMVFSMALWTSDVYLVDAHATGPLASALYEVCRYLALVFFVPVLLLLGEPLAVGVWLALRRGAVTTDLLLLIGVVAAVVYSLVSVVRGAGPIYFDVAAMILVFLTLGRWFEAQGKLRAGRALDELSRLLPDEVHVVRDRTTVDLPREVVEVGDIVRVFPGERFAVDGLIVRGSSSIDEQMVNGESRPVHRRAGDHVYSGTLNIDGDLHVQVTAAAGQETVSRMLQLVRKARRARGQFQRLADRVTAYFVPAVAVLAVAAAYWHGNRHGWDAGILTGLAVALIACPCALGLATPMAIWLAIGRAARGQVLFRNGHALEQLAQVRAMLFDKTGTLTTGDTVVAAYIGDDEERSEQALAVAAQMADASNHYFSKAIRAYVPAGDRCSLSEITTFPGKGLYGKLNGDSSAGRWADGVYLGSLPWLQREGLEVSPRLWQAIEVAGGCDAPLSAIGWSGRVRGAFIFRERLREDAATALAACRQRGIHVAVATGDRTSRAARLAGELRVPVAGEQLPEDKVALLQDLRARFASCGMVGDGINDAPALAASDVGIAMGCGADLSRDSAAVCLLSNDLRRLPWTIDLARQTVRIVRQNLFWAFSYNVIGIALAASGRLNPIFAALAMLASSAFVISNTLRLDRFAEPAGGSVDASSAVPTSPHYNSNDKTPAPHSPVFAYREDATAACQATST